MNLREAVKVLMLSPIYFRMNLNARMILVREFCKVVSSSNTSQKNTVQKFLE